jgi:hypothetical protein
MPVEELGELVEVQAHHEQAMVELVVRAGVPSVADGPLI